MLNDVPFAMPYMDDIIIASRSEEEYYDHLQDVFLALEYGFRLKVEECSFSMISITYLGTITDSRGRRPYPERVHVIVNIPAPSNVKMLQSCFWE